MKLRNAMVLLAALALMAGFSLSLAGDEITVTGWITDRGVLRPPFTAEVLGKPAAAPGRPKTTPGKPALDN